MATTKTSESAFPHSIVKGEALGKTTAILQSALVDLLDLQLLIKQAHWNLVGERFRSVHLELDEIYLHVREASDEVAERITTLGVAADGRAATIEAHSRLGGLPDGFVQDEATVEHVSGLLASFVENVRGELGTLADTDPASEDLVIGILRAVEKDLWMLQAQQKKSV